MNESKPDRTSLAIGVVLVLVGLMVTGGGVYSAQLAVKRKHEMVRRGWPLVQVMVASRDLDAGRVLTREDLEARGVPEQLVTSSLFVDARPLEGHTLFAPVTRGTPLHAGALDGPRSCAP